MSKYTDDGDGNYKCGGIDDTIEDVNSFCCIFWAFFFVLSVPLNKDNPYI